MFVHHLKSVVIMFVGLLSVASGVRADEIHVIATGAVSGAFKQIVPQFERESGHKLTILWGPSSGKSPEAIPVRLKNGEPADVVIMIGANMDKLLSDGLFAAQSRIDFAKTGIGVGVKVGQTPPRYFHCCCIAASSVECQIDRVLGGRQRNLHFHRVAEKTSASPIRLPGRAR